MIRKKLAAGFALAVVLVMGSYFAYSRWFASRGDSRETLLRSLPADASAVIYADIAELRQDGLLNNLATVSAKVAPEADYKQFVSETGFNYEKDLNRVAIAVESHGASRNYFALADGNFDRAKIETYLRKNGPSEKPNGVEIFHAETSDPTPSISVAFLSDRRIVLFDGADLNAELKSARQSAGHSEWTDRFSRLAGAPLFVLMRQDAAIGALLNKQAPGGLRSPQLGQLLDQLLWVSVAGKPDDKQFRVVLEGECPNEATMRQLSDFLNGLTIMANAGLTDPGLRRQMDPVEREAYQQLLNSVDVMKLDRGTSKAVRVTFVVTQEIWGKLAQAAAISKPDDGKVAPVAKSLDKKKNGGQKQGARRP
jgi:hypothetical protein